MKYLEKLKAKWEVQSNFQLAIIFVVFAITGSASMVVGKYVRPALGISEYTMAPWLFWPLRIFLIVPIYQILLIITGTIFGQFKFFWMFEKKMLHRMSGGILFKDIKETTKL